MDLSPGSRDQEFCPVPIRPVKPLSVRKRLRMTTQGLPFSSQAGLTCQEDQFPSPTAIGKSDDVPANAILTSAVARPCCSGRISKGRLEATVNP